MSAGGSWIGKGWMRGPRGKFIMLACFLWVLALFFVPASSAPFSSLSTFTSSGATSPPTDAPPEEPVHKPADKAADKAADKPAPVPVPAPPKTCIDYTRHSLLRNEPLSTGAYELPYQRPSPECRTFKSTVVDDAIERMRGEIKDPDLFRLFENTFPNTLDTAVKWRGVAANNSDEELAFLITGDINAMWIRDSANQVAPYRTVLKSRDDDVASIFRGAINLQARYLNTSPYCNAFHPPPESGMEPDINRAQYAVTPQYDDHVVFTCNFELDDFGGFLQLSHDYYKRTGDLDFFGRFQWADAVRTILATSEAMRAPTYDPVDGTWNPSPYTFQSQTMSAAGTLANNGIGSPVNYTGMVRSPFRPSDDAALFEFLVPANMMLSRYLASTADIMARLPGDAAPGLAREMRDMAQGIREGIEQFGIIPVPGGENGDRMFAYEVDGFGGQNLMDDANVPSLLSAPFLGYVEAGDAVYRATRRFVLSPRNPWWSRGPVLSAVGSPHIRPGAPWPMAAIVRALTSDDDEEIEDQLRALVSSTDGLGLMHESVSSVDAHRWTRQW